MRLVITTPSDDVVCGAGYNLAGSGYWSNAHVGWNGIDYFATYNTYAGVSECGDLCTNEAACIAFTVYSPDNQNHCYLYTDVSTETPTEDLGSSVACYKAGHHMILHTRS